jgi:hypothetical protein
MVSGACWDAQRAYGERAFDSGERLTTSTVRSLAVGAALPGVDLWLRRSPAQ